MNSKKTFRLRPLLIALIVVSLIAVSVAVYASNVTEGECGNGVEWSFSEDGTLTVSGEGMMNNYRYDGMPWYHLKDKVTKVVIEEGVTHVGELAFYGFSNISEVSLPESTVSIGKYAFYSCKALTEVTVPESVTVIGQYAFRKTSLTSAVMMADGWSAGGNELVGLADTAEAAKMLTSPAEGYMLYTYDWRRSVETEVVEIENGSCGDNVIWTLYSDGLLTVYGSGDMKDYGPYATPWNEYKNRITRIVIGDGITSVGYCAFYGCSELTSVELPETLVSIDSYAFFDCRAMGAVTVPANVETIGSYAFRKCFAAKTIALGNPEGWSIDGTSCEGFDNAAYVWQTLSTDNYKKDCKAPCRHNYVEHVETEASTFIDGLTVTTCTKCGDSYDTVTPATKSLKILCIGNSFSQDATQHLYLVCKAAGIEELVIGNLYRGGCSLDMHYSYMENDSANYTFYLSDDAAGGMVSHLSPSTAKYGIEYTDWDYITLQQVSQSSGMPDHYGNLQNVIDYVSGLKNENAKFLWHMTWAYQGNSTHSGFVNYNKDQMTMYNAILSTTQSKVLTNDSFVGVIPSGTAIQNLRTSYLGDTLTRDGYHLSNGIGRYTAALTFLAYVTGYDVDNMTAYPTNYSEIEAALPAIREAVKNAVANPYEITASSYPPTEEPEKPSNTNNHDDFRSTISALSAEDRAYLLSKGYDPDRYASLDINFTYNAYYDTGKRNDGVLYSPDSGNTYLKFLGTQVFNKSELVVGSLIRVDAGYKYRPEGWNTTSVNGSNRPALVYSSKAELFTVTDEWWGDYDYRGFNVAKGTTSANEDITLDEAVNFKIYVPITRRAELNDADRAYLISLGLDPDEYQVLDFDYYVKAFYNSSSNGSTVVQDGSALAKRFICTNIMNRYDLAEGSVIYITDAAYQYRPDAWTTLNKKTSGRPGNVTAETVTVNEAWWGSFNYRGFNVSRVDNGAATEANASAIRIYTKRYTEPENTYPTTSGLTEDDRAFLIANGYDPDLYTVLDLKIYENTHYNSTSSTGWGDRRVTTKTTDNFYNKFLATQIFSKSELVNGTLIRIDAGYQYRPDAWKDMERTPSGRPDNVTANLTVVDDAWWGSFNYRAFNISSTTSTEKLTYEDGSVLRIYVPIARRAELNDADRAYLESLGLNPDDYKVLDFNYTVQGYYNSAQNGSSVVKGSSLAKRFIALQFLTKYDLTEGSVIHCLAGYKYRPDGWSELSKKTSGRPAEISTETVIVDEAWWREFFYRGINISKSDNANVTTDDADGIRIYVKVK